MDQHLTMIPALFDLSTTHLIIILVILLLLFGAKLPSIMRNLGSSVNEFKKGMDTPRADNPPSQSPSGTVSRTDAPPAQTPPAQQNNPPPKA